ncbi:MAG: dienelactone hydrolase family protein [Parvularculaceae bacterium]
MRGIIRRIAAIALAAAAMALSACAQLNQLSGAGVERVQSTELRAALEPGFRLHLPPGDGPFPIVVAIHGCGGPHRNIDDYVARANRNGVALMEVDSFGPRGITYNYAIANICRARELWGRERAGDVLAALDYLREQSDIDGSRMMLLGWSHGSWTVMDLFSMDLVDERPTNLIDTPREGVEGVRAALLFYPICNRLASLSDDDGWDQKIRTHFILVKNDVFKEENCIRIIEEDLQPAGVEATYNLVEGVTHAFDEVQFPESRFRYDEDAAQAALDFFENFISETLL